MDADREASRRGVRENPTDQDSLHGKSIPNYKPTSLQLPFLIFVGVYICALFAILEYGFHTLSFSKDGPAVPQDKPSEVFIYGPLINARRRTPPTRQTLPTAQATSGRLSASKSPAQAFQKFPRWAVGNGSDLGTANTTAASSRATSVSGLAPSATPSFNQSGSLFFANRSGALWRGTLNGTWLLNGTGLLDETRRLRRRRVRDHRGVQERDQDPGDYAQPEPSLRKLFIDFHYLSVGSRTVGQSLIRYQSYNDDSGGLYRAACVGPAIVFLDMQGWAAWQYLASYEKQWREGPHGADWQPLEISDGADKCSLLQAGGGLSSRGTTTETADTTTSTVPVEIIVITDSGGHPVSTSTRLLSTPLAQITTETLRDSQGRPTRTVVEAVAPVTTLRDAAARPTATIMTDIPLDATYVTLTNSKGVPTATAELLTLRDSNGVPTATEALELDSNGIPTATDELELATLKNESGVPTATVDFELVTLRNAQGIPTATVELELLTLRNANGQPTATITSSIGQITGSSGVMVLTDSNGTPIATVDTNDGLDRLDPGVVTLTDSDGIPTATATGFYVYTTSVVVVATSTPMANPPELCDEGNSTSGCVSPVSFHPITQAEYAAAFFVPVLLGLIVSLLAKVINSDVKTLLPFQALARPGGAAAANSLGMEVGGIEGFVNSWKLLWKFREAVSLLSDVLLITSTVVVALSSGSFGAKLYGNCAPDNFDGCFMGLALYTGPSRAIQSLLAFMLLIIILLCVCLRRGLSGVAAPPTSMAVLSSLLPDETSRGVFQDIKLSSSSPRCQMHTLDQELKGYSFSLRYFRNHHGVYRYGIVVQGTPAPRIETSPRPRNGSAQASDPMNHKLVPGMPGNYKPGYFTNLSSTHLGLRAAFLFIISGFLALILYYESTRLHTSFERFMDDQNFGVRILFTSLGLVISSFWSYQFSWVSVMEPYRRLSRGPQLAKDSIHVWPPSNAFVGFVQAVRRGESVAALVALASILSQFTPILLSNIPFSPLQTWTLHLVCAWMVVAILGFMILVLLLQSATKYPYLPVDPRPLAGRLYYLADSAMLADFRGTSMLTRKELVRLQTDRKTKYSFGRMVGISGRVRIGVDYAKQCAG